MKKLEDAVRQLGGVWPSDDADAVYLYKIHNRHVALGLPGGTALYVCTRTEFEECARRLRNEPRLEDAPDWAVAWAQDSDGVWSWFSGKPLMGPEYWVRRLDGRHRLAGKGEVIGDWKQTLRLRPEEEKMEDKNDWYERGELPPVGAVCRLRFGTTAYAVVTITYIGDGVLCYLDEKGMEYSASSSHVELRPLQTERERWVEMARKATFEADEKQNYYEAIYDAGLAKMPVGE